MVGFSESDEFVRSQFSEMHAAAAPTLLLGRALSADDYEAWVAEIDGSGTDEDLIASILASPSTRNASPASPDLRVPACDRLHFWRRSHAESGWWGWPRSWPGPLSGAPVDRRRRWPRAGRRSAATRAAGELLGRPSMLRGAVAHVAYHRVVDLGAAGASCLVGTRSRGARPPGPASPRSTSAWPGGAGQRSPRLPTGPQVADHLAFGALVGAVLAHDRRAGAPIGS